MNDKIEPKYEGLKDKIVQLKEDLLRYGNAGKMKFAKNWYRNINFIVGRQWIRYNTATNNWDDYRGPSDDYPKPVTNQVKSVYKTLKSLLTQNEPRIIVTPAEDTEESIATAETADSWVDIVREESDKEMADEIGASWVIATGGTFFLNYYKVSKDFGSTFVPFFRCGSCMEVMAPDAIKQENETTTCECGAKNSFSKAVDGSGKEMGAEMPNGKLREDAVSPLDIYFNTKIENVSDLRQFVYSKRVPISKIKELYPEVKDKVPSDGETGGGISDTYRQSLFMLSNDGQSQEISNGKNESEPEAIINYVVSMPTNDFDEGLWAVVVGNEVVEAGPLWSKTADGTYFLPLDYAGCDRVPGRFYHASPIDDIVQLQITRNIHESFIWLWNHTIGAAKWIKPRNMDMDTPDGDPSQIVEYQGETPGDKPERLPGLPTPPILVKILEMVDNAIDKISGTMDVLRGQLPSGLDTFSGLRLLTERAYSVHNNMIQNWERANVSRTRKKLEIARIAWVTPRKKMVASPNGSWEMKQFDKADLMGGIDIKVEKGSTVPKSAAAEAQGIIESVKLGLVDISDIKVRYKVLERLGQTDLYSEAKGDIKDGMKEWKEFAESVKSYPEDKSKWVTRPRKGIDNELMHYLDAVSRAKSDEFFELPPAARQMWEEHILTHKNNLDMEAAQKAQMQGPPKAA